MRLYLLGASTCSPIASFVSGDVISSVVENDDKNKINVEQQAIVILNANQICIDKANEGEDFLSGEEIESIVEQSFHSSKTSQNEQLPPKTS